MKQNLNISGFLGVSVVKNLPANAGDSGLIPGLGRSLGGGNGNPLQYSCLENSMDRRAWWTRVHGVAKCLDTTYQLNNNNKVKFPLAARRILLETQGSSKNSSS